MRRLLQYLTVLSLLVVGATARKLIPIGALFHKENLDSELAFRNALNRENMYNNRIEFKPIIRRLDPTDSFAAEKIVCGMASEGVAAIFGPSSIYTSNIVASICAELGIPHILVHWQPEPLVPGTNTHALTRNFFPRSSLFSSVLGEIADGNDWKGLTIVYDRSDSLERLHDVLQLHDPTSLPVTVRQLTNDDDDYKPFLKDIEVTGSSNIILDSHPDRIIELMQQASGVKMLEDYQRYFITSLDAHNLDFADVKFAKANITTIRLMNINSLEMSTAVFDSRKVDPNYMGFGSTMQTMRTESALLYDAVHTFATVIRELNLIDEIMPESMRCSSNQRWHQGQQIIEYMSNKTDEGMTGRIIFDNEGYRTDFFLEVLELNVDGFKRIATWNAHDKLVITRSEGEVDSQITQSLQNKTIIVSARMGMPWLREKEKIEDVRFEGNDRYEGYTVDLIDMIAKLLGFQYRIDLVPNNAYGSYNKKTKKWDGLVKQLLDRKADLAICDLTITYERRLAVDFTNPFMTLGISILFAKPNKQPPALFSFMAPLSLEVWMYMVTTYLAVSVLLFFMAKFAGDDWENPHPCNDDPEELENIWNMHNCVWLTVGAIMQQGCDLLPKAIPTRLIVSFWWFFALIVTSSYTANLAAYLTKEQMEVSIESAEDLASQSIIKYGAVTGGSTAGFFKESNVSTYQKMWSVMESNPTVFTKSNDEGEERVAKGKHRYAFLMESSAIDYIVNRNCNLTQIGKLLDSKGYGIALPFNSPYRKLINLAVLKLQEEGKLYRLKEKWWKEKNAAKDGESCGSDPEAQSDDGMGMGHVGGVFLVLVVGCMTGVLMGIVEFLWNVRNVAIEKQTTPWEAFKMECLFALDLRKTSKPVYVADDTLSNQSFMSLKSLQPDETAPALDQTESDRQMHSV